MSPETPLKPLITLAEGGEGDGLAGMLAELIRQNLEQNPYKRADFDRLGTVVRIEVPDAGVSATLVFDRGSLLVERGSNGDPAISIRADSGSLLELCSVRMARGLPDPLSPENRALLGRVLRGEVRIGGALRSPMQLLRFARLMTVRS